MNASLSEILRRLVSY